MNVTTNKGASFRAGMTSTLSDSRWCIYFQTEQQMDFASLKMPLVEYSVCHSSRSEPFYNKHTVHSATSSLTRYTLEQTGSYFLKTALFPVENILMFLYLIYPVTLSAIFNVLIRTIETFIKSLITGGKCRKTNDMLYWSVLLCSQFANLHIRL